MKMHIKSNCRSKNLDKSVYTLLKRCSECFINCFRKKPSSIFSDFGIVNLDRHVIPTDICTKTDIATMRLVFWDIGLHTKSLKIDVVCTLSTRICK